MNKIAFFSLMSLALIGGSHEPAVAQNQPGAQAAVHSPKIHLVEVVDQSGCKGLKGGLASSAGRMLGGLGAYKLKRGAGAIQTAGNAGERLGNEIDNKARCTQAINIQPGIVR